MRIYYTIYKVTNLINGFIYIGQHSTKNLNDRYIGSGLKLKNAIKKYGRDSFKKEILFVFDTFEEMNQKEAELVTEDFIRSNNTYNIVPGGSFGIGQNNKGRVAWNKGKTGLYTHSLETKQLMSEIHTGVSKTQEHRANISKGRKGNVDMRGEKNPFFGRKHSDEAREKMRRAKMAKG